MSQAPATSWSTKIRWRTRLAGCVLFAWTSTGYAQVMPAPPTSDADWRRVARECTAVVRGRLTDEFFPTKNLGTKSVKRFMVEQVYKDDDRTALGPSFDVFAETQFYDHGMTPLADVLEEGEERLMFLSRPVRDKELDGQNLRSRKDMGTLFSFDAANAYEVCEGRRVLFWPALKITPETQAKVDRVIEQVRRRDEDQTPTTTPTPSASVEPEQLPCIVPSVTALRPAEPADPECLQGGSGALTRPTLNVGVYDAGGNRPAARVTVWASLGRWHASARTTDTTRTMSLVLKHPGEYEILVRADGCAPARMSHVRMSAGCVRDVRMEVKPEPGPPDHCMTSGDDKPSASADESCIRSAVVEFGRSRNFRCPFSPVPTTVTHANGMTVVQLAPAAKPKRCTPVELNELVRHWSVSLTEIGHASVSGADTIFVLERRGGHWRVTGERLLLGM